MLKSTLNVLYNENLWKLFGKLQKVSVCSSHVTYAFQSESTLYTFLNVKELLARRRREILSLSNCNWKKKTTKKLQLDSNLEPLSLETNTQPGHSNGPVWLNGGVFLLRTKWFWAQLQSLKLQISHLLWAKIFLTFRQVESVNSLWNVYVR